jgi:sodium-dependent dicarboxylate transporter 2/3/5
MWLNRTLTRKRIGLILGPFLFALFFWEVIPIEGLSATGRAVLACTLWIATWWMTEAIPISAASLLPIVILPVTGGASINQTTAAYGDKMLFLFVGGFIIAIAMQKWNLHKRIALSIIAAIGGKAHTLILGFMIATGFLSMWISNTATTLMMVTIAIALISQTKEYLDESGTAFFKALLLSIAFSSSIGGVATLIGTPTNPIFVAIAEELYGVEISFTSWMIFALPFSIFMLFVTWVVLTRLVFKIHRLELPVGRDMIRDELKKMGKMSFEEKTIAWIFGAVAVAWITRSFLLDQLIPGINDTTIAIAGALLLFVWPSSKPRQHILTWDEAERLPWGIIILFGGGLSLAAAFESSGLALWLGMQLSNASNLPLFGLILMGALSVNFITEVVSNVATASIALPILAALASAIGVNPYLLMVPATMAASCAFMLPVATAPNAIVFGSGHLEIQDMVKSGIWLNLISTLVIAALVYFLVPVLL